MVPCSIFKRYFNLVLVHSTTGMIVQQSLVFTIIGPDRPGIVENISHKVEDHGCNWLGSKLSRLGGKFAGIVQVEGAEDRLRELQRDLVQIEGLSVVVESAEEAEQDSQSQQMVLTILGLDRPGIVHEVSSALASQGLNVLNLETEVSKAAMTGRLMFHGQAVIESGGQNDIERLSERLEQVSRDIGIDVELEEED